MGLGCGGGAPEVQEARAPEVQQGSWVAQVHVEEEADLVPQLLLLQEHQQEERQLEEELVELVGED